MNLPFQSIMNTDAMEISRSIVLENETHGFAKDVLKGLSQPKKSIPSVYFYDKRGSELFNLITKHPDYYLTNCEIEILQDYAPFLSSFIKAQERKINLIELGPGEGTKTSIVIQQFLKDKVDFVYMPIDVCDKYLDDLEHHLMKKFKSLVIEPKKANYLQDDNLFPRFQAKQNLMQNLVLFLGSSIGNFDPETSLDFFINLGKQLKTGDFLLIGFDLWKELDILLKAYNDDRGITKSFNLNLLNRINTELKANFVLENFNHAGTYNISSRVMESYLISLKKQQVTIESLNKTFDFAMNEMIHVENSYKYTLEGIHTLAKACGFDVVKNFMDSRGYFVDSLWKVKRKAQQQ